MIEHEVILSDGQIVKVRQLGMFELDDIPKNVPPPYTVSMLFQDGEVYETVFDTRKPRLKPKIRFEEVETGSIEWHDWQEYLRYQAALLHQAKIQEAQVDYCERIAAHIRKTCLPKDFDQNTVIDKDWSEIEHAALAPLVTIEEVMAALANTFQS